MELRLYTFYTEGPSRIGNTAVKAVCGDRVFKTCVYTLSSLYSNSNWPRQCRIRPGLGPLACRYALQPLGTWNNRQRVCKGSKPVKRNVSSMSPARPRAEDASRKRLCVVDKRRGRPPVSKPHS